MLFSVLGVAAIAGRISLSGGIADTAGLSTARSRRESIPLVGPASLPPTAPLGGAAIADCISVHRVAAKDSRS